MAVTLTQAELSSAIRLGDSAEEVAEATRLLAFATEAITRHLGDAYEGAPVVVVNEAAIRLAGYLFDHAQRRAVGCHLQTRAGIRARGRSCCRSGCTGQGPRARPLQAAQEAVGTTGQPGYERRHHR